MFHSIRHTKLLIRCKFYEVICNLFGEELFVLEGDVLARNDDMIICSTSTGIVTKHNGLLVNYYGQNGNRELFDSISDCLGFGWRVVGNVNNDPDLYDELDENTADADSDDKGIGNKYNGGVNRAAD